MQNIKDLLGKLKIERIFFIDDDIEFPSEKHELEDVLNAIEEISKEITKSELKKKLKDNNFSEEEIQIYENLQKNFVLKDNNETYQKIIDFLIDEEFLLKKDCKITCSSISLSKFITYIEKNHSYIEIKFEKDITNKLAVKDNDLLIVDYDFRKTSGLDIKGTEILETLKELINSTNNIDLNNEPNDILGVSNNFYILFLSSKKEFVIDTSYDLTTKLKKNDYFRKLREEYNLYQCVLFNYINKEELSTLDEHGLQIKFEEILLEYSLTKKFFDFLNKMYKQIFDSKAQVFKDFYSLNLKTLKTLIEDKIVKEGISEFKFFNDLICNLINKTNLTMSSSEIHRLVNDIKEIDTNIEEYYLDKNLLDIRRKEVYEDINTNCLPLDIGDIFTYEYSIGKFKDYLLISQQCDLVIRGEGARGKLSKVTLLENCSSGECSYCLKQYQLDSNNNMKSYNWKKINPITLPTEVLDLTTINKDGRSVLDLNMDINELEVLLPNKNQRKLISDVFEKIRLLIEEQEDKLDKSLKDPSTNIDNFRYIVLDDIIVKYRKISDRKFDFLIKRESRVDLNIVLKVQQEYLNNAGRMGLRLDYAETLKNGELNLYINDKKVKKMRVKIKQNEDFLLINEKDLEKFIGAFTQKGIDEITQEDILTLAKLGTNQTPIIDNNKYLKISKKNLKNLENVRVDLVANKVNFNKVCS